MTEPVEQSGKFLGRGNLGLYLAAGIPLALAAAFVLAWPSLKLWYYSAAIKRPGANEYYCARGMIECGRSGTDRVLRMMKNGSYDGDVEQLVAALLRKYARQDVAPQIRELLADPDPKTRAFACTVAGHLGDRQYVADLEALTTDESPLPKGWFDRTVAARAAAAIGLLTSPESPQQAAERESFESQLDEWSAGPPRWRGMQKRR